MIYRHLLSTTMSEIADSYDIIILDEYHRCGAPKWGKKVIELLEIIREKYPEIKRVCYTCKHESCYFENEKDKWEKILSNLYKKALSSEC